MNGLIGRYVIFRGLYKARQSHFLDNYKYLMIIDKYLDRIKFQDGVEVNVETLLGLHKCHVLSIPFEDLDIHFDRCIKLDVDSIYEKVVLNNRGGFCYELNYLFYTLLKSIGFDCKMVSSRIYDEDDILGPEFDHMSIIVKLEDDWLVDVGYGDLFMEPLIIVDGGVKKDQFKDYMISSVGEATYLLSESRNGEEFKNRYIFDKNEKRIEDFYDQCEFKQFSKDSYFVKNKICTIPTLNGRVTLMNNKLIEREGDSRKESEVKSDAEFDEILKEKFGMNVS